jgi:hypothetical protein
MDENLERRRVFWEDLGKALSRAHACFCSGSSSKRAFMVPMMSCTTLGTSKALESRGCPIASSALLRYSKTSASNTTVSWVVDT